LQNQTHVSCHAAPVPPHSGEDIRERTDALDAAGNTTAAIGKGFAIGSAALVSLALFGAYVTRSKIDLIESSILDPKVCRVLKFKFEFGRDLNLMCQQQFAPGAYVTRSKFDLIESSILDPKVCRVLKFKVEIGRDLSLMCKGVAGLVPMSLARVFAGLSAGFCLRPVLQQLVHCQSSLTDIGVLVGRTV
jgi:hypothetical protein